MLDIIPFMLIGMALLKMGVLSAARSPRFYAAMVAGGYAMDLSLGVYEYDLMDSSGFSRLEVLEAGRTYQISRLAMVCGHLGLLLLIIRLGLFRRMQGWFAFAGQMALSNYMAQSIICMFLFYGFGFGLFEKLDRAQLYSIVAIVTVVQIVWSIAWLKRYRYGPLEWLWRSLTYWKPQPMRLGGGPQAPIGAVPGAA